MKNAPPELTYGSFFKKPLPGVFSHSYSLQEYVWELLEFRHQISSWISGIDISPLANIHEGAQLEGAVRVGERSVIGPAVTIKGPVIIGNDCKLEHGATIGPNCYLSDECKIGHASVVTDSLLFEGAEVGSGVRLLKSIVGGETSILMGAATLAPGREVEISIGGEFFVVEGFGAIIGERATIGINAIVSPGSLIGMGAVIDTLSVVSGYIPPSGSGSN